MIDYDAVLGELHLQADRIQSAITALTALANRQEAAPVPPVPTTPSVHLMPDRATTARKNGQRKAAEARAASGRGAWKERATGLLRAGRTISEVAAACKVSKASVYALNGSLGLAPPRPRAEAGEDQATRHSDPVPVPRLRVDRYGSRALRPLPGEAGRLMDYATYLRSPAWRVKRREALQRAGHRCQRCGDFRWADWPLRLDVHHRSYTRLGCELEADLVVLCRECHQREHGTPEDCLELPTGPESVGRIARRVMHFNQRKRVA